MGGPNNLLEVETFLRNMFADPNILTTKSKLLRSFIGNLIVTNRVVEARKVYEELGGKSPIVDHTKRLVAKLQEMVSEETYVDFAMRYTPPFASEVCQKLEEMDVREIYLIPLYPQYSTTTTKSSLEDFEAAYAKVGGNAKIFSRGNFYRTHAYNQVILKRIEEALGDEEAAEFELVFSAHGLPQKIVNAGDPYQKQIERHVELLKKELVKENLEFKAVHLAYQSKVGPMKWLEPSLEEKLKNLSSKKVLIFPIAFTIDNSETDYELGVEYAHIAKELGFEEYRVARCPNDHKLFVESLYDIYLEMKE